MSVAATCASCGEGRFSLVVDSIPSIDTDETFSIEQCSRCGVMHTAPVPDDLTAYYDTDLALTMMREGNPIFSRLRSLALAIELKRIVRWTDATTILDVGCGAGDFLAVIAGKGFDVMGADSARRAPALLTRIPGAQYRQFDFDSYALSGEVPRGPFVAIVRHVLEHARDPHAMLTSLSQLGADAVYVVVPNVETVERRLLGRYWYLWDPPRHLWHFSRSAVTRLVERSGFTVEEFGYGTAPTLVPSIYRYLRTNGYPRWFYDYFGPTGALSALSAPLNCLVARNVMWLVARRQGGA